jgi:hypothetical protein
MAMAARDSENPAQGPGAGPRETASGRRQLLILGLLFLLPVVAAYVAYFFFPPSGRTNYGELIEQRDVGDFPLAPLATAAGSVPEGASMASLRGRWVFVVAAPAACDDRCRRDLYNIRQVRLTTGDERDRIERLWIVTDERDPPADLLAAHEGLRLARADPRMFAATFPAGETGDAAAHIYLVDPLGHLMMRFPADPDPSRMKKDISRLLKVSRIG